MLSSAHYILTPSLFLSLRLIVSSSDMCPGVDWVTFLAFLAVIVVNCTAGAERKLEEVNIITDAAGRFLGVVEVSGEVVQQQLREALRLSPTPGQQRI